MSKQSDKNGPWHIVSSEVKYENPWMSVREDKVIHPDGNPGIFGIVTMPAGVTVLPIDDEGNVYLVKEYKYAVERKCIGVISGGCDDENNRLESVHRELKEEAGIIAASITELGYIDPYTTVVSSKNYLYIAQGLEVGEAEPEGGESIELMKVPFQQAYAWVLDSTISHGGSVAVICKAKEFLKW